MSKNVNIFVYIGRKCECVDGINKGVLPPFPVYKYSLSINDHSRFQEPCLVCYKVDRIMEPAFVVQVNGTHSNTDLFTMSSVDNMQARYYVIPMEYLLRDGGYGGDMDFENASHDAIQMDKHTLQYLRANDEGRERMYKRLLDSLQKNSEPPPVVVAKKK